jgi:hypothetical protein
MNDLDEVSEPETTVAEVCLGEPVGEPVLLAVSEWAEKLGHKLTVAVRSNVATPRKRVIFDRWHASAAALHCWGLHKDRHGAELLLTEADYCAALEAAKAPECAPYAPALSTYAPESLRLKAARDAQNPA